jgi:hypothetical protein
MEGPEPVIVCEEATVQEESVYNFMVSEVDDVQNTRRYSDPIGEQPEYWA